MKKRLAAGDASPVEALSDLIWKSPWHERCVEDAVKAHQELTNFSHFYLRYLLGFPA